MQCVPAASRSKSSVTIAIGFDLGQRNETDLKKLGVFDSGGTAHNCAQYFKHKRLSEMQESTGNFLVARDYVICDS